MPPVHDDPSGKRDEPPPRDESPPRDDSRMLVGLGHGTTAGFAIARIGELLRARTLNNIVGIPCSRITEAEARRSGIPTGILESHPEIDLTIDGADEVDPQLNMIKGGGGALLREKVVAEASKRCIYIIDESKLSPRVGTLRSVPVEVIPFAWKPVSRYLQSLGATSVVRREVVGRPFLTDEEKFILDCTFGALNDPGDLGGAVRRRAGVIEHGLFLGLATDVIVSGPSGLRHMTR
ncbi:MAG: ribose 5-phosphate isomerase A [Ignavibacteria bacterium]|nr:MAG: ribose 5-phosphate isomerase A [Ignavibacteria bacterium]